MRFTLLVCLGLLLWSITLAEEASDPKRILTLHWYGRDSPANVIFDWTLRTMFLPKRSIILNTFHSLDGPVKVLARAEVPTLIAESASVPIYGISDSYIGRGSVGGDVTGYEAGAATTAEIALRVARVARPQEIPVVEMPTVPVFYWRQLRRWEIPDATLPAARITRFREPTIWQRYKWQIVTALLVGLIQAVLIGVLLEERRRRRKDREALERTNVSLRKSMAEINNLNGRLISAQEDERRRISRELHDDVSQQIAALGIRLSVIRRNLGKANEVGDGVAAMQRDLMYLTTSIHALSHELHPAIVERAGLTKALKAHCEEFETVNGIKVHFMSHLDRTVPSDLKLCIYRITQEALRNIVKHSGAKEAWVSLDEIDDHIQLTVEDAGRGFHSHTVTANGIGLVSMKERVRMVGGTFDVDSRPGGGTVTRVVVPVAAQFVAST